MIITKKSLQKQIEQLKRENEQYRLILQYTLFDLEATRREKCGALAQAILLREELAEMREKSENNEWFPSDDQNLGEVG